MLFAAVAAMATPTSAGVIFSDDFEADTVGANPAGPGWTINEGGFDDGDTQVVTGTPTGGTGDKVYELKDTTGVAGSWSILQNHTDTTQDIVTLSTKVKFGSTSPTADFRLQATSSNNGRSYLRMRPDISGGSAGGFSYHQNAGGFAFLENITIGAWYQLVQSYDFTGSTWSISIDNLDDAAAPNVYSGLTFSQTNPNTPFNLANFSLVRIGATNPIDAQFDDFVVTEIPEPSAIALGSLAVMLMGASRRRIG